MNEAQLNAVYYTADGKLRPKPERDALMEEISRQEMAQRTEARRAEREASESPNRNQWSGYREQAERAVENAYLPGDRVAAERRLALARQQEGKRAVEIAEQSRQAELAKHPLVVQSREYFEKYRGTLTEDAARQIEAVFVTCADDPNHVHTEVISRVLDGLKARREEQAAKAREAQLGVRKAEAEAARADVDAIAAEQAVMLVEGVTNDTP